MIILFRKKITLKRLKKDGWVTRREVQKGVLEFFKTKGDIVIFINVQVQPSYKRIIVWVRGFMDGEMRYMDELNEYYETEYYKHTISSAPFFTWEKCKVMHIKEFKKALFENHIFF